MDLAQVLRYPQKSFPLSASLSKPAVQYACRRGAAELHSRCGWGYVLANADNKKTTKARILFLA